MASIDHILVAASVLLLLSVLASKASAKLGVPALLRWAVLEVNPHHTEVASSSRNF